MKKRILYILCAVVLISAGISAGVYAVGNHQQVEGQKLVGCVPLGFQTTGDQMGAESTIRVTNPDCVGEITINKISILKGQTLMYEGLPLTWDIVGGPPQYIRSEDTTLTTLGPHEGFAIPLVFYMWKIGKLGEFDPETVTSDNISNDDNWLKPWAADEWEYGIITVEID